MTKTIVIAEAGVNHNGKISLAKKLIDKAKKSGADYIKFQIYKTDLMITKNTEKASYQKKNLKEKKEKQFEMLKKYELSFQDHLKIYKYCKKKKIKYLASVFDENSLKFLEKLDFDFYKIPSSELTNIPLLLQFKKKGKKILLSTGMSTSKEISITVNFLINLGFKKENIILLHCNSSYPTPLEEVNLKKMITLKNFFNLDIGFSDHTQGLESSIAAAALGASVIERHVTLNNEFEGPDHIASLEFDEFAKLVSIIRKINLIIGNGKLILSKSEKKNINTTRKFLVAKKKIIKGEKFSEKNITAKRTGSGISGQNFVHINKKKSLRNYEIDEIIKN